MPSFSRPGILSTSRVSQVQAEDVDDVHHNVFLGSAWGGLVCIIAFENLSLASIGNIHDFILLKTNLLLQGRYHSQCID